jgi:signal transduction histidine kinase
MPRSVRGRAVLGAVTAILVFGAALGTATYVLVSRIAYSSLEEVVRAQVEDVEGQLSDEDIGTVDLEATEISSPVVVQVVSASGEILASTPRVPSDTHLCDRPDGYLTVVTAATGPQGPVQVCAAASLQSVEKIQEGVLLVLAIVLPMVVAGVGVAVWLAVGRALGSVEHLREQAERMTSVDDGVLEVQPTGDEVENLGHTLNDLIDRLHAQTRATRQFVADAGHELRNPLATLRVALEFGDMDRTQGPDLALVELDRLEALVQDLLVLARSDAHEAPSFERLDLAVVVADSVRANAGVRPDVDLRVEGEPCPVEGDARSLRSAVDNLLANALRHATTRVDVRLATVGSMRVLTVDDDGEGLRAADCERVFDRFVRLDESRVRDEGGSGLGLAIVSAVAVAHGGAARAEPGPGGHFVLALPARG